MKKIFTSLSNLYKSYKGIITAAVLVFVVSVIFVQRCTYRQELAKQSVALDSLTLANQTLDSAKNKAGQTIVLQTAIITSNQADIKRLSDEKFNLQNKLEKKVRQVLAYQAQFSHLKLDSVKVPYVDSMAQKRFSDSIEKGCAVVINYMRDSTITVPAEAKVETANYKIDLSVKREGVVINSLDVPDSQYFRIVVIRGGFFRKVNGKLKFHIPKQIQFQTLHTNPLIHVTGSNSVLYKSVEKPKILLNLLKIGIGVYLGTRL